MALTQVQGGMILPSTTLTTPIVATTMGVGGATPASSGSGITFPATQSASTDANTLDDYEEGTFTPSFTNISGGAIKSGIYVKIGSTVFVRMIFANMACTGSTSVASAITGLPFTSSLGDDNFGLAIGEYYNITNPSGATQIIAYINQNNTTGGLYAINGSTGASLTTSNFSAASATLVVSGVYKAA